MSSTVNLSIIKVCGVFGLHLLRRGMMFLRAACGVTSVYFIGTDGLLYFTL
jgi:hypothetical protein